jgi:hypothetical protein
MGMSVPAHLKDMLPWRGYSPKLDGCLRPNAHAYTHDRGCGHVAQKNGHAIGWLVSGSNLHPLRHQLHTQGFGIVTASNGSVVVVG